MSARSDGTIYKIAFGCDDTGQIHYLLSAAGERDTRVGLMVDSSQFYAINALPPFWA
jgi:hypothetical protein